MLYLSIPIGVRLKVLTDLLRRVARRAAARAVARRWAKSQRVIKANVRRAKRVRLVANVAEKHYLCN